MTTITITTAEQADRLLNEIDRRLKAADGRFAGDCYDYLSMRRVVREIYAYRELGLAIEDAPLAIEVESLALMIGSTA